MFHALLQKSNLPHHVHSQRFAAAPRGIQPATILRVDASSTQANFRFDRLPFGVDSSVLDAQGHAMRRQAMLFVRECGNVGARHLRVGHLAAMPPLTS